MTTTKSSTVPVAMAAAAGIALISVGLWLAALSNPKRFSLDPRADTQIHLFAIAALASTGAGMALFLAAVNYTTQSMPSPMKRRANLGVGIGFLLQLAGFFLYGGGQLRSTIGLLLMLTSLPVFIGGCLSYAEGKGYSKWIGLLGAAGILGLVVLMVLPGRTRSNPASS